MMLTNDTVKDHCSEQSRSILKYFLDPSSRLSKEEFKGIVYRKHNIEAEKLNEQNREKVNQAIDEGYKRYLEACQLIDENKVNFRIKKSDGTHVEGKYIHNLPTIIVDEKERYLAFNHYREHYMPHFCYGNFFLRAHHEMDFVIPNNTALMNSIANSDIIVDRRQLEAHEAKSQSILDIHEDLSTGATTQLYVEEVEFQKKYNNSQQVRISQISGPEKRISDHSVGDYDINEYNLLFGNNPIILAICKGWNHINPERRGKFWTKFPQKEVISVLLKSPGLDLNVMDLKTGMSPLHIACFRGDDPELIRALLEKGADKEAKDYQEQKPINMLDYPYEQVKTILHKMIGADFRDGNRSYVATLPTEEERNENIKQIREILCSRGKQEKLRYIPTERMEQGRSGLEIIEQYDGSTRLYLNLGKITLEDIREFCEKKNIKDNLDYSLNGHPKATIFMLIFKSELYKPERHDDILEYLSSGSGFNIDKRDSRYGNTTLMWCCENGDADSCLKLIRQFNANPFINDNNNKNALHLLIAKGYARQIPVVELIVNRLDIKDHINGQTNDGLTALHLACAKRDWTYIELLIKAGASLDIKDGNNRTPLDILDLSGMKRMQVIERSLSGEVEINTYDPYVNDNWIKNIATFNKETFYTDPRELRNKINQYRSSIKTLPNSDRESGYSSEEDNENILDNNPQATETSNSTVPSGNTHNQPQKKSDEQVTKEPNVCPPVSQRIIPEDNGEAAVPPSIVSSDQPKFEESTHIPTAPSDDTCNQPQKKSDEQVTKEPNVYPPVSQRIIPEDNGEAAVPPSIVSSDQPKSDTIANDVKLQQERSTPQTAPQKPKSNNNKNYIIGGAVAGGAVIGFIVGLIIVNAALTPILASVAVLVAAAVAGAIIGYCIAKFCEKVSQEKEKSGMSTGAAIKTVLQNTFTFKYTHDDREIKA